MSTWAFPVQGYVLGFLHTGLWWVFRPIGMQLTEFRGRLLGGPCTLVIYRAPSRQQESAPPPDEWNHLSKLPPLVRPQTQRITPGQLPMDAKQVHPHIWGAYRRLFLC